jgi:hypothetical protein
MNKNITAALALAIAFTLTACEEKKKPDGGEAITTQSGSGVKLLESMTTTRYYGSVEIVKFEYDSKDRIAKIHRTYDGEEETETLHYDGNKLMKKTSSRDDDFNEDYSMEGDMVRVLDDIRPVELTLNKGGYMVSYAGTDGSTAYSYQNGNRIKFISYEANESESTGERIEAVFEYDSKKSPFLNCKTPKWFLQYKYFANANNLTASTQKNYDDNTNSLTAKYETTYVYEYDSDGFPTKQTDTQKSDGETYTTTTTFKYIGK